MKLDVAIVVMIVVVFGLLSMAGCQLDVTGPDLSAKLLYEGENNGEVHKSRNAGAANGRTSILSWGIGMGVNSE